MKTVSFVKYTSYGNNFVIVDETDQPMLSEKEKSAFAYAATNVHYGVGSDNFLVIQPCTGKALADIQSYRRYWHRMPDPEAADFIFRMFEPDGTEALCCGNGLMCIADYLFRAHGLAAVRMMTEIPTDSPRTVSIGTHPDTQANWANMGHPRRMPQTLVDIAAVRPHAEAIDRIDGLTVTFRAHDLAPFTEARQLELSGYLVHTGEPHMVVFSGTGISLTPLQNLMFVGSNPAGTAEKRVSFGSWLIHHIGTYVNKHYSDIFPQGININFARIDPDTGALEYRCFERGIFRETLACGTGALAVSYVVRRLNLIQTEPITIWPHRCRWEQPGAEIMVREETDGWFLIGDPFMLFAGDFVFNSPEAESKPAVQDRRISEGFQPPVRASLDVMHY